MPDEEEKYIRKKLDEIAKSQQDQANRIDRIEKILLSDQEAGTKGLGNRVNSIETRVEILEKYKRKFMWAAGLATGALTFLMYWGKELFIIIKNALHGSGKS